MGPFSPLTALIAVEMSFAYDEVGSPPIGRRFLTSQPQSGAFCDDADGQRRDHGCNNEGALRRGFVFQDNSGLDRGSVLGLLHSTAHVDRYDDLSIG